MSLTELNLFVCYRNDYVYLCRKRRGAWKDSYATQQTGVSYINPVGGANPTVASITGAENQKGPADSKLPAKTTKATTAGIPDNHGAKRI